MNYKEESIARDLYRILLTSCHSDTEIAVQGAGTDWHCTATRGARICLITCFDMQGKGLAPQYLVSFKHNTQEGATSRTTSQPSTIAAIVCWLDGYGISELQRRFTFVDSPLRSLATIEKALVQRSPELKPLVTRDLHWSFTAPCFRAQDRSCRISYNANDPLPDCAFYWDECELFRFQTEDLGNLAAVLKRWLCDYALPSQMRAEFPWIRMSPLADYYEVGRGVEGEFLMSWDQMESFYRNGRFPLAAPVLEIISEIRTAGFDMKLRAGQSMWSLGVSRSRRHGLRPDQPRITFIFRDNGMDVCGNVDTIDKGTFDKHTFPKIKFTPEVAALLQGLAAKDID